jgi:hypothetical protein
MESAKAALTYGVRSLRATCCRDELVVAEKLKKKKKKKKKKVEHK